MSNFCRLLSNIMTEPYMVRDITLLSSDKSVNEHALTMTGSLVTSIMVTIFTDARKPETTLHPC